jgi:hypothetical protein
MKSHIQEMIDRIILQGSDQMVQEKIMQQLVAIIG